MTPVKVVDGQTLECKIDGVPRGALPVTLDVRVCAHWAESGSGVHEDQCALAAPMETPALAPTATGTGSRRPPAPTIESVELHPRTLARHAHVVVRWSPVADCKYEYRYDSGRRDIVNEGTEGTAADFDAATNVRYEFRVRARHKPVLFILGNTSASQWAPTSMSVPVQQSVLAFLNGTDARDGLGRLLRSRGLDPASLRRVLAG
jgi:hypothetical protein